MVTLPELTFYSSDQIAEARRLSRAVDRYLPFLDQHPQNISDSLRLLRHKHWVQAALAVLFKTATAEQVCKAWSIATRHILDTAWKHCQLEGTDVALLEMGKLGAEELNLSSDIDIFFVSQNEPTKENLRKVRQFIQLLSEKTRLGFCYRIDTDLRPGGGTSPLILAFDQMTNHYGYHGETWERVAIVRQQIRLGPAALKKDVFEFCRKFAFRRHIDYGLFSDLQTMRERIQFHRGQSQHTNIKFLPGGIRDLELLIHSLQLIHGGKNPALQTASTTQAIDNLHGAHLLKDSEAAFLKTVYWRYRDLENRIQLQADAHTYEISPEALTVVSVNDEADFLQKAQEVQKIVEQLLAPYKTKKPFVDSVSLQTKFDGLGLDSADLQKAWEKLLNTEARSREKERDEEERRLFLNGVLDHLRALDVDNAMALQHLSEFISTVKAKTSFFSLLNQHKELAEEIVWIFSSSPYLAQILIHRPELIDSFLLKKLEIITHDESLFYQSLQDYKLLAELIAASSFLRTRDVAALTHNLSAATDTIIRSLLDFLKQKMGAHIDILTLGKWAGREMGLTSDLDFVFITPRQPETADLKTARRFINFLSSSSTGSTLYSIDLRLRPSGHAGPLLMTLDELRSYLEQKAQIWERQAYMSSRLLSTDDSPHLLTSRPLTEEHTNELRRIQAQLLKPLSSVLDLKKSHGGLLHSELTLQIYLMNKQGYQPHFGFKALCDLLKTMSDSALIEKIYENYQTLRTYQQLLILVSGSPSSQIEENQSSFAKLCLISKTQPKVLFAELTELLETQRSLLIMLDPLLGTPKI